MARTLYGFRQEGRTHFVIVAPHAAGDDLRTKEVAQHLARQLGASLVVNEKFIKPSNSAASRRPQDVEDFNQLPWTERGYGWARKKAPMKQFYDHVKALAATARSRGGGRAVIIYIHGMEDNSQQVGIDIGAGAKYHRGAIRGAGGSRPHPEAGSNTGVVRAKRADIDTLKSKLDENLQEHGLRADVGRFQPAWSRQNGVQFHAGTPDHSIQLELSTFLRKHSNVEATASIIANALKATYPMS
ncbi:hypothetical protein HYV43_05585 [Candidatus Micrarchaeota archaeon]|nr:hypothetical protein [Candidatus Micrarchaeota archaeon]